MKTRLGIIMLLGAFLFSTQNSAQAREPYKGSYHGSEERKVPKAKPKKRKLTCNANIVQDGPSTYDSKATLTATGKGEKIVIVLDLDASNNGTVSINGTVVAGPGARSRAVKKLKLKLDASGTATFVGPLRQTIAMSGKSGKIPFTVTGVIDLDATGGLILDLKLAFSKDTALGKSASFSFRGARELAP